jgi:transposase
MAKVNIIGVDLAKNVIQAAVLTPTGKTLTNKELPRKKFAEFLAKQPTSTVAFEACASAHYWARQAEKYGHKAMIIPAKAIIPYRQGHKTDRNDAVAVAEAASRPTIKEAPIKTIDQQGLQAIQRSRDLLMRDRTAHSNHIRGLLMEFGIYIPKGIFHLRSAIPEVLEDADNELPDMYRPVLACMYRHFQRIEADIKSIDLEIKALLKENDACSRIMELEGVGPIGAILLFATLGTGEAFKSGREFSAYIGLTPKQHSSGGKTNFVGISKFIANHQLRAVLVQGARAYVHKLKDPTTPKQKWLHALILRAGYGRAAVALANKTVRTAWALLTTGTEYDRSRGAVA